MDQPFVPGYEYDLFISYARVNDCEKWVTQFRQKLEARIRERIPNGIRFFRDVDREGIAGNQEIGRAIDAAIKGTAVFVPILSHAFVERDWCRKECSDFVAACRQRGLNDCIFPVRYDDVSPAEYAELIGSRPGYEFFENSNETNYSDTLAIDSERFKTKLNILRTDISDRLTQLKQREGMAANSIVLENEPTPTVLLAEPAKGLGDHISQLTSYLHGCQIEVLRPGERFYERADHEAAFQKMLKNSLVFVQVLGRLFDPREDDDIPSWDLWQLEQARALKIPTLQWFNKYGRDQQPIDLLSLDARHRRLVTQPEVWDCDWQQFRDMVRNEVDKEYHNKRQVARKSADDGIQPLVVLRAERSDAAFAEQLGEALEALDCDWLRIPDKDLVSLDDFAKEYAANGLLVIYRACPGKWILSRLQELRKFVRSSFGQRWVCGMWRAPEDEADAMSCSMDGLIVIGQQNPDQLKSFVARLKQQMQQMETAS